MLRQLIQRIKAMLLCIVYGMLFVNTVDMKIKACNALNAMFVKTIDTAVCGSYTTLYTEYYEVWKLCIKWPLTPPRGKAIWKAFSLVGLAVHQSEEAALLTFLDLSTTRVIAVKMHSQSPILKLTKGALSNLVILTYLWEKSCILHTLTKLPDKCMNLIQKVSSMLEECGPVQLLWRW